MIEIYGIPNCDTVKKARKWLDDNGVEYQFIDFRKTPVSKAQLTNWADTIGMDTLLNKRSRTWRELDDEQKNCSNPTKLLQLLLKMPTLIKRPVLVNKNNIIVGFNSSEYAKRL